MQQGTLFHLYLPPSASMIVFFSHISASLPLLRVLLVSCAGVFHLYCLRFLWSSFRQLGEIVSLKRLCVVSVPTLSSMTWV